MREERLRFRTVVFDLDGTLADSSPDLAAALNVALARLGRAPQPLAEVRTMIGYGARAMLRRGLEVTGGADDALMAAGFRVLIDHYTAHICDATQPYAGVDDALAALADQGIALAVCTNKPRGLAVQLIGALGWAKRFGAVIGGDSLPVAKPDPAPLHLAIERAGGGPAAMVGDSIIDIRTAIAAGVPSVAVSFGFADRPAEELGADRVIDSFSGLIPALAEL